MNDQEGLPVSLFVSVEFGVFTNRLWYPGCSVTGVTNIVSFRQSDKTIKRHNQDLLVLKKWNCWGLASWCLYR